MSTVHVHIAKVKTDPRRPISAPSGIYIFPGGGGVYMFQGWWDYIFQGRWDDTFHLGRIIYFREGRIIYFKEGGILYPRNGRIIHSRDSGIYIPGTGRQKRDLSNLHFENAPSLISKMHKAIN